MTAETPGPTDLRQDIERTRERLGETVERLAAKADVRGQAKAKATELAGRVKSARTRSREQSPDQAGRHEAAKAGDGRQRAAAAAAIVAAGLTAAWLVLRWGRAGRLH